MRKVFVESDNIISSLGFTTEENVESMLHNRSGIRIYGPSRLSPTNIPLSLTDTERLDQVFHETVSAETFTRFEKLVIASVSEALSKSNIPPGSKETVFILSTTKGNIDLLEGEKEAVFPGDRKYIWKSAALFREYFDFQNDPVIICNACISGVLAINTARMLLETGRYKNAVVVGADIMSRFVISGFQSFQSLSPNPCKPFDKMRDGLSLGEGSSTLILTTEPSSACGKDLISVIAGSGSNDANHISGPSRTGEGLYHAIRGTLQEAGLEPGEVGFVSSHGTATDYNDEMEAKAFKWAGLENVPLNSFKGYFGHTMGAAGVIESVLSIASMRKNILLNSYGFEENGVSVPLDVIKGHRKKELEFVLKTASGFGGCNAALIFKREK